MPKIMHSLLFEASTHRIDDIPDAEVALRFGQEQSPNACFLCHADRDADWLTRQRPVVDDESGVLSVVSGGPE